MDDYDEDSRSRSAERKRSKGEKKKRKDKRHKKSRHRRRRDESDEDESTSSMSSDSFSSSSYHRHHSKKRKRSKDSKKKHKRKKDRKHRRHKTSRDNRSRSRSPSASNTAPIIPTAPPGAHELANALKKLFTIYPNMASIDEGGIPILFIQLSRGTEYNLTHMPDKHLAGLLEEVFQSLRIHGMELLSSGAWKWGNATGNDLALLRLTRALLNGVGINMDTIQKYESIQHQQHSLQTQQQQQCQDQQSQMKNCADMETTQDEDAIKQKKRIERCASQLLDRFDRPEDNGTSTSASLANELTGICDAILEEESIQLDGIENAKLKASLAQLFELAGLEPVEVEDDDDDDDDEESTASNPNDNEDTAAATQNAMGYALPESNFRDSIASNVREVLRVCRFRSTNGMECAPTSWAATKTLSTAAETQPESSDEDGPAPLGSIAAAKATKRKRPNETSNIALAGAEKEGGREEWMMVPGEHDFLKGIISKSNFRGRTFKNSKSKSAAAPAAETVNPVVLAEVQAIQQAYEESRGPSLLDAHRQNKKEKQEDNKKQEWKWNREKNLDDGRRVDKNARHLVL